MDTDITMHFYSINNSLRQITGELHEIGTLLRRLLDYQSNYHGYNMFRNEFSPEYGPIEEIMRHNSPPLPTINRDTGWDNDANTNRD